MNLIVGATGQLGTSIARLLLEQGKPVRALVRTTSDPARVDQLRALGAELAVGDLTDPASLRAACAGVRTVVSTATVIASQQASDSFTGVDDAGQRALIDAARSSGVDHFVFISVSSNLTVSCPLIDAKRAVERHLMDSGVAYTILRPTAFMEVWLGPHTGFDHAQRKAALLGTGEQHISYVSSGNVAQFAAACVDNSAAHGRGIQLGGPEAISPWAAVRSFEKYAGAGYEVRQVPIEVLAAQYQAAAQPVPKSFAALMLALASDDVIPMNETAREFGVQLKSVAGFAQQVVSAAAVQAN